MGLGRQQDHTRYAVVGSLQLWKTVFPVIFKKRSEDPLSVFASNHLFVALAGVLQRKHQERNFQLRRSLRISLTCFEEHRFPYMSDDVLLSLFRFRRTDLLRVVEIMGWPQHKTRTTRNRYSVTPLLATCVVLRRLASSTRWGDLEEVFGLYTSQLSETFWEALMLFVSKRLMLVMGEVQASFWSCHYAKYASAVQNKSGALGNVVAFIDGTNLKIARPGGDNITQRVAYNGHKRAHAIKFQAVTTPCGMAMNLAGPMEGRRHDWTLYNSSGLEETLQECLHHAGTQYVIYGDSGYSSRCFLFVPFSGSYLTEEQKAFNTAMARSRVTVEWYFREVKRYWTFLDFKRKMRIRECAVGALYIAACLLTNIRNCCYPNIISQYFDCTHLLWMSTLTTACRSKVPTSGTGGCATRGIKSASRAWRGTKERTLMSRSVSPPASAGNFATSRQEGAFFFSKVRL